MSSNKFEFIANEQVSKMIDSYLAKNETNQMEVDSQPNLCRKSSKETPIWEDNWDKDEHENGFFKELMEELTHVGEEQQQRLSNGSM